MGSFKFFFRNLINRKGVSVLAIGSLSIGIAITLLIGLWVFEELSFDRFHEKGDYIYRICTENRDQRKSASTFRQLGDNMKEGVSEVKEICRVAGASSEYEVNQVVFQNITTQQVDENFFTFFSFPLKSGNAATCLDAPGKMVISESIAERWFSGSNPVGQVVKAGGEDWQITAVMKDIPYNSHLQADVFVHFYGRAADLNCGGEIFRTYVYAPGIPDFNSLENRITQLSHQTNSLTKELGRKCELEPLKEIHFGGVSSNNQGNRLLVVILAVTALAILLIAIVNFVNLFIATSFLRIREIGVRKTFGADKKKLILIFYRETLGYVFLATVIAVILAVFFLPLFNRFVVCELSLSFDTLFPYLYLLGIIIFTCLVAGSYPAFYMTRFGVADTLNRQFRGKKRAFTQNSLVVTQFSISITFLILMFFVYKQVHYMIDYDLGFNKENIVCMKACPEMTRHYDAIRNELLKNPQIKDVSLRDGLPMNWADGYPIQKPGSQERIQFEICQIKPNMFDLLGMELIAGENSLYNTQLENVMLIDELAVERLELKEPIGSTLQIWGTHYIVKGVVRTTKNKALNRGNLNPLVYLPVIERYIEQSNFIFFCKITGNPREAIQAMQAQWEQYQPKIPFRYEFLDDEYQKLYESEIRLGNIFLSAMVTMLLLSVCGLFAIAYYKMQWKIKEIGVRKINGASIWNLFVLLNTGFVRLAIIAYVLSGILAYYFANLWLENFTVRTNLSWWVFAGAGAIAVALPLLTICYLTLRTARMNPVDALKSE